MLNEQEIIQENTDNRRNLLIVESASPIGMQRIIDERNRQVQSEGWTSEHDDTHINGELVQAARCFEMAGAGENGFSEYEVPANWPWSQEWWKPKFYPVQNYIVAGALIQAEIERLQRVREHLAFLVQQEELNR